jgi:hypothetical protein
LRIIHGLIFPWEHRLNAGSFSPLSASTKNAAPAYPIVCLVTADASMGGLTDEPAFGELLRLRMTEVLETHT